MNSATFLLLLALVCEGIWKMQSSPLCTEPVGQDAIAQQEPVVAFSGTRYARLVQVIDGKRIFLIHLRHPALLARDPTGKVRIQTVEFKDGCGDPSVAKVGSCDAWYSEVFDPVEGAIFSWADGPGGARGTLSAPLTPAQISAVTELTSNLGLPRIGNIEADDTVTTLNLGTRQIGGVSANGVRTTISHGTMGSGQERVIRIHEEWTSPELHMVIKVVDGDPNGRLIISGLTDISLHPDPTLFRARDPDRLSKRDGRWSAEYIRYFENFFQPDGSSS